MPFLLENTQLRLKNKVQNFYPLEILCIVAYTPNLYMYWSSFNLNQIKIYFLWQF